ncbi:MAG: MBL fold metallo-hydrolase [Clostridia bacterium]|nr:MBL fold metallo-hydrolase [Clostridia bacterium]
MSKKKTNRITRRRSRTAWTKQRIIRCVVLSLFAFALLFTVGLFCYTAYRLTGTVLPTAELWDGKPTIRFIDVGQGDCTLITYRGDSILIDAGPASSGDIAAEYVRMYAPKLDCFIITHPHEDHMGGAEDVLRAVDTETLILSDIDADDAFFTDTLRVAEQEHAEIIRLNGARTLSVGEIEVEILDSFGFAYEDLNDASLVIRVTVGETTMLVTGDAEAGEEEHLLGICPEKLDCDILKVGHHGSKSSTTEAFVAAVSPQICVISVGRGNSYGHPAEEVTRRIETFGAQIRRTDREGHVIVRGESSDNHGLLDIWRNIWYH